MSEKSWLVLVCALIAVLLLATFIIQGLTIRLGLAILCLGFLVLIVESQF